PLISSRKLVRKSIWPVHYTSWPSLTRVLMEQHELSGCTSRQSPHLRRRSSITNWQWLALHGHDCSAIWASMNRLRATLPRRSVYSGTSEHPLSRKTCKTSCVDSSHESCGKRGGYSRKMSSAD